MASNESHVKNNSIDLMRLLCAIIVVTQHIPVYFENLSYSNPFWYMTIKHFSRMAVPFFFVVSGYFYTKALINHKDKFKSYFSKLFITYSIWAIIYFPWNMHNYIIEKRGLFSILKALFSGYFVFGNYYQFWYFPVLFFCIIISSIFAKRDKLHLLAIASVLLYIMGALFQQNDYVNNTFINRITSFGYYFFFERVFFKGIPFFMLGYIINKIEKKDFFKKRNIYVLLPLILILGFVIQIAYEQKGVYFTVPNKLLTYFIVFFIMLFCIHFPLQPLHRFTDYTKSIANFLYYSHPLIIEIALLIMPGLSAFSVFIIPVIVATLLAVIIVKINNRFSNKLC